jgi:MoaA/NifB/PqqE/SkfB family radical SAM enzyme|tara:strand:- start:2111 stop:3019 length:909 start_codon:yes stop_codon:yes gene_type:complete
MANLHIEPTSKCTLECPLCDRTWFYETFKKRQLHEINVDNIVNFVGVNSTVEMCGNNGDPIYHSRFLELCKKFKDNNCSIDIHTNGSSKTRKWWEKLKNILTKDDSITFAIDGLEDTNHIYRKNAKWKSIMDAVDTLKQRDFKITWQFIPFKHNQHQILEANRLSKKLGFDEFKLLQSDRWLGKKELMPDREYVNDYYQHQESVLVDPNYQAGMSPACIKNDVFTSVLYVDAEGDFYPCCWMGTYRYKYKSVFSPKGKKYNIKDNTLNQILENKSIKEFFASTKQFTSAHECCKIQCGEKHG